MSQVDKTIASKVLEIVDHGLSRGLGDPVPGNMCVEAAVCAAYGLPHSDTPPCVGRAVRTLKIRLNDQFGGSKWERAKLLRRLAIAQLGSDQIDQVEFAIRVSLLVYSSPAFVAWAEDWLSGKDRSRKAAEAVARVVAVAASNAARAAWTSAWAAAWDMEAATWAAATWATNAAAANSDFAEQVVQILIKMKSPGTKFLYLTERENQ